MRKRWKKGMALALAAAICVPAGGTTIFAADTEFGENRQIQDQFDFVTDFNGGVQGPVWYHEYLMISGNDQGKTIPYEEWVQDWNCWIGLSGVLTSGMENDMGLIAPASTADSLITWKAPKDGVVGVSLAHLAYLRRQHQTSGNVSVYIQKNDEKIYPLSGEMLIQAQSKMYLNPITVEVQEGDRISLALRSKKNLTDASAYITPVISYVEKEVKIKENLTQGAAVTVSSAASGYSASGLTDYNISEQQKNYEWKAETADQEWIDIAFDNATVSDIVLVDSSEGAYTGDIRCTFSDGESVSLSAAQLEAKDGIRIMSLESPVRTSSVKIEFLNNNDAVPILGDIQILGERLEPEEPDPIEAAVYYIDSENGSDGSDGKSEDAAWASAEAEKAKAEAEKAKAEADEAKADVEKAQAEAERAKAEADKAQAEADRASEEAKKAQAEADLAKAEYDRILLEREKAAARAEQLRKELEETKKALEDQLKNSLKEGDDVTWKNVTYRVLDASKKTAAAVKGKNVASVTIAKTVKIKGITCTVTEIAEKAFMKSGKLTKVTIGENVQTIGKWAFYGAGKLKNVTIKSRKLKSVKQGAFSKISLRAKISVPKMKKSDYRSILKGKIPKKAVVK